MIRTRRATPSEIAAARLRRKLDRRLGRPTPDAVIEAAEHGTVTVHAVDRSDGKSARSDLRDAGVGESDAGRDLGPVDPDTDPHGFSPVSQEGVGEESNAPSRDESLDPVTMLQNLDGEVSLREREVRASAGSVRDFPVQLTLLGDALRRRASVTGSLEDFERAAKIFREARDAMDVEPSEPSSGTSMESPAEPSSESPAAAPPLASETPSPAAASSSGRHESSSSPADAGRPRRPAAHRQTEAPRNLEDITEPTQVLEEAIRRIG